MTRFIIAVGAAIMLTNPLSAHAAPSGPNGQTAPSAGDCDQIRQAVKNYGYAAARKFALIHYGKDAVKYGDRCLAKKQKLLGAQG